MGRIRTKLIKRLSVRIVEKYASELKKDYAENKQILAGLIDNPSKKLRNVLAGSVTKEMKQNN